ncbi:hypothetical protein ACEN8K_46515, partial [Variovorax sp. CT11-76]
FPPHLSADAMQLLRPLASSERMRSTGTPGALDALSAQGRIDRLLYTDRGDVNGVLLADQTIVRFPPHVGAMYRGQLRPGAELHARVPQ